MTSETWDELAGRLYGVLIAVEDRLGSERAGEAHHYIEVGEYGLALEEVAGVLGLVQAAITSQERDDMLALGRRMKMDDSGLTRWSPARASADRSGSAVDTYVSPATPAGVHRLATGPQPVRSAEISAAGQPAC